MSSIFGKCFFLKKPVHELGRCSMGLLKVFNPKVVSHLNLNHLKP